MFVEIEKNVFVNTDDIISIKPADRYKDGCAIARAYCGSECNGMYDYFLVYPYYIGNIAKVLGISQEECRRRYGKKD